MECYHPSDQQSCLDSAHGVRPVCPENPRLGPGPRGQAAQRQGFIIQVVQSSLLREGVWIVAKEESKGKVGTWLRSAGWGHKQEEPGSPDSMAMAEKVPRGPSGSSQPLGLGRSDVLKDQKGLAWTFSRKAPGVITTTSSPPSKRPGGVSTHFQCLIPTEERTLSVDCPIFTGLWCEPPSWVLHRVWSVDWCLPTGHLQLVRDALSPEVMNRHLETSLNLIIKMSALEFYFFFYCFYYYISIIFYQNTVCNRLDVFF